MFVRITQYLSFINDLLSLRFDYKPPTPTPTTTPTPTHTHTPPTTHTPKPPHTTPTHKTPPITNPTHKTPPVTNPTHVTTNVTPSPSNPHASMTVIIGVIVGVLVAIVLIVMVVVTIKMRYIRVPNMREVQSYLNPNYRRFDDNNMVGIGWQHNLLYFIFLFQVSLKELTSKTS